MFHVERHQTIASGTRSAPSELAATARFRGPRAARSHAHFAALALDKTHGAPSPPFVATPQAVRRFVAHRVLHLNPLQAGQGPMCTAAIPAAASACATRPCTGSRNPHPQNEGLIHKTCGQGDPQKSGPLTRSAPRPTHPPTDAPASTVPECRHSREIIRIPRVRCDQASGRRSAVRLTTSRPGPRARTTRCGAAITWCRTSSSASRPR